ncbi:MAG: molybdopterin-dependent oxidoreductase [Rhodospirillaceae bacterium]|nr:molybdopterin-dependent oxidoreductase [Rhodospirillaceae bacterium]MBT5037902.1 molybdopterin-dependent oxidoreductase [Rhodospirillaceae bacterium]MBT5676645.1 molybdopterin-dependent oxidoreductase [Rhodospirillaceae bacterium]MBT5780719.1 molybdopterin-dependent oxidoreductase [Rhodospirillaceae bacterium]MBT7292641.1 molybdopterin-dependent oxidoreductase [Rhodospirillaceae bacterium]
MTSTASTYVSTVCPHDCPSTCALEVERLDANTIGKVRGARDNDYTAGVICAKVARYAERIHHPGRVAHPLRRTGNKASGEFQQISWDDALDEVAEAFLKAEQGYGSEAVWPYFYAGTMGLVQRFGLNRLRNVKRYSGQLETICSSTARAGYSAGVGACMGSDPREMAESDLILCWGVNPASTQVNVMTHISRARKERGAKLVVIDPYQTRTAKVADLHLALRPGTDGALACAVMHILFREGLADRDYLSEFTDFPPELEQHLSARGPDWAAPITGLSIEEITEFARLYGRTERSFLRLGYGFTRTRNGAANMHAATCLPAVTGAWRHKGGGAFFSNGSLYDYDKTLLQGLDALDPDIRVLDMSRIGPVLTGDKADLGNGPPVTATIMQNTNPAVVAPESAKVNAGLRREDFFLAVHEQFMTDTAKLADIVLPATTFLEHDDFYLAGGHSHVMVGARMIEPFAEARDNHFVVCELAKRLGAEHRGFDMSVWQMIDDIFLGAGWPSADAVNEMRWYDCAPSFDDAHFLSGFKTDDKKFHFRVDWPAIGTTGPDLPALPDYCEAIDASDEAHPFRLVTAPAHNYLNTSFTETETSIKREDKPSILLAPVDAKKMGVSKGTRLRVGNMLGEITLPARIAENGQKQGVVVIESVWPNGAFENGLGVNTLTSADPAGPVGGAVFHDTSVWVKPA